MKNFCLLLWSKNIVKSFLAKIKLGDLLTELILHFCDKCRKIVNILRIDKDSIAERK